jgi:DNA-binding NtrC family response regulator
MSATHTWRPEAVPVLSAKPQLNNRLVVVASGDPGLRERLRRQLADMRWRVIEAGGGAEAMAQIDAQRPEALVVDSWLPDLEVGEFSGQMGQMYAGMDVLRTDGRPVGGKDAARSPRRNELLHAIRESEEFGLFPAAPAGPGGATPVQHAPFATDLPLSNAPLPQIVLEPVTSRPVQAFAALPEMVGASGAMEELTGLIRLVAPRTATVLIEGETGTGKEVVAKALHRLSARAGKPFVVLNCAAIPESLLEAELFGHTRGAFTGAVQSRTGRIEAAHGGTLFLDEIGEMPLALQAKMLRFLECGELQKVGENETMRVDVRVIAATHQPLEQRAEEHAFRLDLYHRLAVFPLEVPALRDRMEDLPLLVEFFLEQMGRDMPRKVVTPAALERLRAHRWPGNVRELMHVLERGAILAGERREIDVAEIRVRSRG